MTSPIATSPSIALGKRGHSDMLESSTSVLLPTTPTQESDIAHGIAACQGGRVYMEDAYVALTGPFQAAPGHGLFMIADGHGGPKIAHFLQHNLPRLVAEEIGARMAGSHLAPDQCYPISAVAEPALLSAYRRIDASLPASDSRECGSTALTALVSPSHVVVANVGDSRSVLSRGGVAVPLSHDHSPDRKDEQERVKAAGGLILRHNGLRVMGVLAMTRAFGDMLLRQYGVIPEPDVITESISESDEFLILASDGLWAVMGNQEAVNVCRLCISRANSKGAERGVALRVAARVLMRTAGRMGSKDNCTVIVVDLIKQTRKAQPTFQVPMCNFQEPPITLLAPPLILRAPLLTLQAPPTSQGRSSLQVEVEVELQQILKQPAEPAHPTIESHAVHSAHPLSEQQLAGDCCQEQATHQAAEQQQQSAVKQPAQPLSRPLCQLWSTPWSVLAVKGARPTLCSAEELMVFYVPPCPV